MYRVLISVGLFLVYVQIGHAAPRSYRLIRGKQAICLVAGWRGSLPLEALGDEAHACLDRARVVMVERDPRVNIAPRARDNVLRFRDQDRDNGQLIPKDVWQRFLKEARRSSLADYLPPIAGKLKPEAAVYEAFQVYFEAFEWRVFNLAARLGQDERRLGRPANSGSLEARALRFAVNAGKDVVALDDVSGWRSDLDFYEGLVSASEMTKVFKILFVGEKDWDERAALALSSITRVELADGLSRDIYLRGGTYRAAVAETDFSNLIISLDEMLASGDEVARRRRLRHEKWLPFIEGEMRDGDTAFVIAGLEHIDDEGFGKGTSLVSLLRSRGFKAERIDGDCNRYLARRIPGQKE
jgi:hypothetical protein